MTRTETTQSREAGTIHDALAHVNVAAVIRVCLAEGLVDGVAACVRLDLIVQLAELVELNRAGTVLVVASQHVSRLLAVRLEPEMQERLTQQIGDALERAAAPRGVAVVVQCSHMCMCSRGVRKDASSTSTSDWRGEFAHNPHLRDEFWRLVNENDGGMTAAPEISMRARL